MKIVHIGNKKKVFTHVNMRTRGFFIYIFIEGAITMTDRELSWNTKFIGF